MPADRPLSEASPARSAAPPAPPSPRAGRHLLSRRQLLQAGIALAGWAVAAGCAAPPPPPPPTTPTPRPRQPAVTPLPTAPAPVQGFEAWSRHARLANATGLGEDPSEEEMSTLLARLRAEHVSVVEVDIKLSDWLTDHEFEALLAAARRFNQLAHAAGLKVVWYYPSLEVITPGGEQGPSFYKTYPDWTQLGIDGRPNVFYGAGVVFWVDPGAESVWLSPNGPWHEYYLARVQALAQTGADGLWPDVPIYFNGVVDWCDYSPWGQAAFRAATGREIPTVEDWADPTWRQWIAWRHANLNQWILDIAAAGRAVNPAFATFVETVTMDYYDATLIGLDGAYLRLADGVTQVWEVDVVSEDDGMRHATEDDWICLIAMYKYARAASGQKPAWAFSYGKEEDDAVQVMAECLAAGCNPYEVKTPEKTAGVSSAMRTRLYTFVEAHTQRFFDAHSLADVAVYHSSASRDYVQPSRGTGLFASTAKPPDAQRWWSTVPEESCYQKQWLGEYRGTLKALLHAHLPFEVVTSPTLRAEDLAPYHVVVLPDVEALSDHEAVILRQFVQDGGTLVATGPNPGGCNEYGDERPEYALAEVLGLSKRAPRPATQYTRFGQGQAFYLAGLPGWDYLRTSAPAAYEQLLAAVRQGARPVVTTDANQRVHLEARALPDEWVLHFVNRTGRDGQFTVVPTTFSVSVQLPEGRQVAAIEAAAPERPTPALEPLAFEVADGQARFTVAVEQYVLVVVRWT